MTEPFVGEIRIVAFSFAPRGWMFCNGQIIPIAQNTDVFSIVGTTYGGNGTTTFGVPNLQGRFPMHTGNGFGLTPRVLGEMDGNATVTLLTTEMPVHTHALMADLAEGDENDPGPTSRLGTAIGAGVYNTGSPGTMNPLAITSVGSGALPHDNQQPYLTMNFIFALQGIFPARN